MNLKCMCNLSSYGTEVIKKESNLSNICSYLVFDLKVEFVLKLKIAESDIDWRIVCCSRVQYHHIFNIMNL